MPKPYNYCQPQDRQNIITIQHFENAKHFMTIKHIKIIKNFETIIAAKLLKYNYQALIANDADPLAMQTFKLCILF